MEYRPPPKAQKITLNVWGCGFTAQKKPLISLAVAENKDVIVHMAVASPAPGPSTDALVLPHRWMAELCRLGAIKSPLIEECPLGSSCASNGRLIPPRCAFLAFCLRRMLYYVAPQKHRGVFCSHFGAPRSTNQVGTFYKSSYYSRSPLF
jgi:hypothetical protein